MKTKSGAKKRFRLTSSGKVKAPAAFLSHNLRRRSQKRKNEAKKKQKTIDVKEIKLRPNIDEHDYQVKLRKIFEFLDSGDKVKVTMRYRGREMAHQQIGIDVLGRVKTDTEEKSKIELEPKLEGRQMIMVLAPGK